MDLLKAVQSGSLKDVEDAVKSQGISDYYALNTALINGNIDIAKFLISQNFRVNKPVAYDKFESTPLHKAVELKNVDLVKLLLQKKASITAVTEGSNTPLHLAFIAGLSEIVSLLVEHIGEISEFANCKNDIGLSHLHMACTTKHSEVIKNYLKANANIEHSVNMDSPKWAGYTAFHFAVTYRSVCVTKILSNFQRYVNKKNQKKDNSGFTALDLARIQLVEDSIIMESMTDDYVRPFYLSRKDTPSAFHLACMRSDIHLVKLFLKYGAPVNHPVSEHINICPLYSPLHFAVESRCKKIVKLLLESGADVSSVNSYNMTALHLAMYVKNDKIVDLLRSKIKDKEENLMDNNKLSYFHIAVSRNDLELVKKILKSEQVDVNIQILANHRGLSLFTPLHFAVESKHLEMVQLLIEHGADVNVVSSKGTALQMALKYRTDMGCLDNDRFEMMELLFKHGADLNFVSSKGTALQMAFKWTGWGCCDYPCTACSERAFDWLLDKGAKVDVTTGEKPLLHQVVLHAIEIEKALRQVEEDDELDEFFYDWSPYNYYISRLIELGCDVNAQDEDGNTALHLAVANESGECSKALVENGADVNIENNEGKCTSLFTEYISEPEYEVVYDHVQNMRALGWKVHPELEETCVSTLKEMETKEKRGLPEFRDILSGSESEQEEETETEQHERMGTHRSRLEEVEEMKELKLDEKTTLYDFMRLDGKEAGAYANNEMLKSIISKQKKFSVYGYLIKLQYRKSQNYAETKLTEKRKNEDTDENPAKRQRVKSINLTVD